MGIFVLIYSLVSASSFAQTENSLSPILIEQPERTQLGTITRIYSGEEWTWKSIIESPLSAGKLSHSSSISMLPVNSPMWMRTDIQTGELDPDDQWLLGFNNAFGGDLSLFVVANNILIQETTYIGNKPYSGRLFPHRLFKFPLTLPDNSLVSLIVRVDSSPTPIFIPELITEKSLIQYDLLRGPLLGLAFGILIAMMFYHVVLAAATFDKTYLTYSLYLASNILWMAGITGLTFKFLWPESPIFERHVIVLFNYAPVILSIMFTVQFLELRNHSPNLYRFYLVLGTIISILIIASTAGINTAQPLLGLIVVISYFTFIYSGIVSLKNKIVFARYYLMAWSVYSLAVVNWMAAMTGLPAFLADTSYYLMIVSFDVQVLLLALALAHRIRSMRQSKIEADADNRAKSEFLARMSHEIRTPLSGVLGMAELLRDRLTEKQNIHYVDVIRTSGKSLLTIINDILDYSKFATGKLDLEKIPFNVQELAVDALDILKIKAVEKNIELIADINLNLPHYLIGDPTRIKQIILNLVSNGIKFTQQGQVVLRIAPMEDTVDMVKIEVIDTGIGIAKEAQSKLFEAFSQAGIDTSRKYGGSGLGLSICKQLAHFMDGEIGVSSEVGKGSTFWVTVKLPASNENYSNDAPQNIELENCRVLIVEDNYTFSDLLCAQARTWGMEPHLASNGQEALDLLESQYLQDKKFDLISLDLFMPIMDGLETSRKIQADPRFNSIPRLLLTSSTNFPSQSTLMSAGINKVVEKPALPSELHDIYKELLAKSSLGSKKVAQPSVTTKKPLQTLNILVAEDNHVNQLVISGLLKRLNQNVTIVDNGEKAFQQVSSTNNPYDLVLMDCDMPVLDGLEATQKIRAWEKSKPLGRQKIIGLSAHVIQTQIDACFEAGMDDYISKPIDITKLTALLHDVADSTSVALPIKPKAAI